MISSTTGNGIDAGAADFLNVYVSNLNVKPASPLVIVNAATGISNVRWGMSGTGTINATAGGSQVTDGIPAGGTITRNKCQVEHPNCCPGCVDGYLSMD